MIRKSHIALSAIVLVGFLDWATTISGILFFGATEINPILSGLTQSSLLMFSIVKLTAITITATLFHKATTLTGLYTCKTDFTSRFLKGVLAITLLMLLIVVSNNLATILRV